MSIGFQNKPRKESFGITGNMRMTDKDIVQYEIDDLKEKEDMTNKIYTAYGVCRFNVPLLVFDFDWKFIPDGMTKFSTRLAIIEWCNKALVNYDLYSSKHGTTIVKLCEDNVQVQFYLDNMHGVPLFSQAEWIENYKDTLIRISPKFNAKWEIVSPAPVLTLCKCAENYDHVIDIDAVTEIKLDVKCHTEHRLNGQWIQYKCDD